MVKDADIFDGSGETGVDDAVKVGVEGLEDGDWTFVCCFLFVMEDTSCDFEERG